MHALKPYPYWWDSFGVRFGSEDFARRPRLAEPTEIPGRVDAAIVGAGYTGLAAARETARRGGSVVVLERERVGWGASSRNGGQVLTGLKLDPAALVARFGKSRARQLFDASLESIEGLERLIAEEAIDCEYEHTGHVQAACKPSHFNGFRVEQALLASVFNHRVELVPASDQQCEINSTAYCGLMVDERSGALDPARFVEGLAAAARQAGAVIAEGTRVTHLKREKARWVVTTDRGTIDAGDIVVATNGYTDEAAAWLRRRLIPIGSYIIVTEPLPPADAAALLPKRRMAFDARHFLHFFRVTRDHRLLFGGRAEFARPTADTTRRCAEILRQEMVRIFPALAPLRVDYAWSGNVAFTRDQLPHAGRSDGAYYAGGYCGHGIAMATHLGALVARLLAGEAIEHPLLGQEFPAIPLYRGRPWFLPLVGAYYRLKDWLE